MAEFPEEPTGGTKSGGFVEAAGHGTLTNFHGCSGSAHLILHEDEYETEWNEVAQNPPQNPPESLVRNVLVNDQDCISEHELSVAGSTPPQNGVITWSLDVRGEFEYTPNQGYRGPEMMFYYASDGYVSASVPLSIYVYWPDIDVDSDNSGRIHRGNYPGAPDDPIEADSNKPGKIVVVNDDDDNGNGVPDYLDTDPWVDALGNPVADDDLIEVNLTYMSDNGLYNGDYLRMGWHSLGMRIWDSPSKNNQYHSTATPPPEPLPPLPLVIDPWDNWWNIGAEPLPTTLWLEGISPLQRDVSLGIVTNSGGNWVANATDYANVSVVGVDLDTDSDNSGFINTFPGSQAEDDIEMDDPGKIFHINNDDDNGNGIPDMDDPGPFVDGQGLPVFDNDLTPAKLALKPAFGANLNGYVVQLVPSAGIRLWASQDKQPLRADLTYVIGTHTLPEDIYVEGIATGPTIFDAVLLNPTQQVSLGHDAVKFTVVKFDLDVDNDGALGGPDDGVASYLPGYKGDEPKVSTGTSYNTSVYTGQQMNLVLEGIGVGQGVDAVDFRIGIISNIPGYAENATDPSITGGDFDYDYSFAQNGNQWFAAGTMEAFSTHVDFWAKDYGGNATVLVEIEKNNELIFIASIRIPLDKDFDGISDIWEAARVADWNTQFGAVHPENNVLFTRLVDNEPRDPDDTTNTLDFSNPTGGVPIPMGPHATLGDGRNVFQEYRGYILDGGGHDWDGANAHTGGHTRLNPAYKEQLVEVDAMENVPEMPNLAGIKSWMDAVTTGVSQSVDGAGYRMFYVIHDIATAHNDFIYIADLPGYLGGQMDLDSFTHLQLVEWYLAKPGADGITANPFGSSVAIFKANVRADYFGIPFNTYVESLISHELHHTVVQVPGDDGDGHFNDTNYNNTPRDADDQTRMLFNYAEGYEPKQLTASITANALVIPVSDVINMTSQGLVEIGSELIHYTSINGNSLIVPATGGRGYGGTTPASHLINHDVTPQQFSLDFQQIRYGHGTVRHVSVR